MPRGDRTGPMGLGPMTGRGAGFCAGYNTPGYANPMPRQGMGFGRGRGRGLGMGMGFGRGYAGYSAPVPLSKDEEKKILEAELKDIEAEKEAIEKRLNELK